MEDERIVVAPKTITDEAIFVYSKTVEKETTTHAQ